MYEILKDFAGPLATLVGAIIGLSVVAWQTQRGFRNLIASQEHRAATERDARADQARIQREIAAEQLDREKRALAAALTSELFSLSYQVRRAKTTAVSQSLLLQSHRLQQMLKDGAEGNREAIMLPIFPIRVPIYEANIPKLGLLDSSLAGDVARVFSRATVSPSTSTGQQGTPQMDIKMHKAMIDGLVEFYEEWLEDISHVISRLYAFERGTSDDPGPLYLLEQGRERKSNKQPT